MCARNATRSFSSFHIVPIKDPTQPQKLLLTDLFRSALEHKSRVKWTKLRNISKSRTPRLKNANTKKIASTKAEVCARGNEEKATQNSTD